VAAAWFLLLFGSSGALAAALAVCPTCEYNTLTSAISAALPYDTVFVKAGIYSENSIVIDKPLFLAGEQGAVLDGAGKDGDILQVLADSVTVTGLVLRNVPVSYTKDYAAIRIKHAKQFRVEGNRLEKVFFGILAERSSHGTISENVITSDAVNEISSGNGIHLFYCNHLLVRDNEISRVRDGIYLEFVDDSRVTGNLSQDNLRYGLHFMFSNRDEYDHNTFRSNGAGVAVMFSTYIDMHDNLFVENWGTSSYGLLLKEISDGEITGNIFEQNTIAVNIEGSNRINYTANEFVSNGWAMKFRGGCYQNHVTGNNFRYNTFDISYKGKMNDNTFDSNYWSAYTGYDLDRNGIGDVPFRPVKLFSYIVNENPSTIVLLRSLFVDLINFSEKVSPVFTPDDLQDLHPKMRSIALK
jgi:nitrous oxidase accessory protein